MNLMPDLFSFAYVPSWYTQLEELAELAIPEPWRFRIQAENGEAEGTLQKNNFTNSVFVV